MARWQARRTENAPGEFFVDTSCIDCDHCRQIAPSVFRAHRGQAIVYHQLESPQERLRAQMALVTCPTASIGTLRKQDLRAAIAAFPERISENVYFCGFASERSFGASSYLILRPQGNVLVDSPRFTRPLVRRLEAMGGVALMFLTHRDDVADHEKFHRHFGCRRILHRADLTRATRDVEIVLAGRDPVLLEDDLLAIPTPGHTPGHQVLLYRERYLFSGDHVWGNERGELVASRRVCWYSWEEQVRSLERLLDVRFEWVLPGHGRRLHAPAPSMHAVLRECLARLAPGR
ncbi:Hydroxyacylglutathione hydrolase [bacterium HR10]|uniref:Beta-lactamase domain protein n=1 Tax=uncultured Acidobacteriota bacterium TaxID=171953 RepID=H5SEN1_9BACT|nr:beta-lactamase domain protein [uncultured Acidobacteriota bacterium]BAL54617.1 beta-lactamase domain protein [uncultured Acidobacteriota bacterium]GBC82641.1 Hydroxyacylglutathione hydrolase [bacterium HR10]